MIPADDFTDYAQELAGDIGAIDRDAKWPVYCIDWERAARELKMNYASVLVNGTTYYFRAF
jgi:antirestriction protein